MRKAAFWLVWGLLVCDLVLANPAQAANTFTLRQARTVTVRFERNWWRQQHLAPGPLVFQRCVWHRRGVAFCGVSAPLLPYPGSSRAWVDAVAWCSGGPGVIGSSLNLVTEGP